MTIHPSWCMAHAPKHTMPKTRSPKWSASAPSMIQTQPQGNVADSSNKLNITRMRFQWICQWRIIWLCIVQLITNWQGWEGEGEARLTAKSHRTGANHGHRCPSWFQYPCQCRCRHHHRQWCRWRKVNIKCRIFMTNYNLKPAIPVLCSPGRTGQAANAELSRSLWIYGSAWRD